MEALSAWGSGQLVVWGKDYSKSNGALYGGPSLSRGRSFGSGPCFCHD